MNSSLNIENIDQSKSSPPTCGMDNSFNVIPVEMYHAILSKINGIVPLYNVYNCPYDLQPFPYFFIFFCINISMYYMYIHRNTYVHMYLGERWIGYRYSML